MRSSSATTSACWPPSSSPPVTPTPSSTRAGTWPTPKTAPSPNSSSTNWTTTAASSPSALQNGRNAGFEQLGSWVHSKGLKFGIHIIRGIPRESVSRNTPIEGTNFKAQDAADVTDACPWDPTSWGIKDNEAGQAWYDSLLRQYTRWGVDFIKVDCISDHPYKGAEIRQIATAIRHSGRRIVLSLSPGPTSLDRREEVAEYSQMWRMSNDIWDVWKGRGWPIGVGDQFATAARWAQYTRPGAWPDADMLPVGELRPYPDVGPGPRHTRLTPAEQQTLLSLWCMARSPLIVGANLTLLDDPTLRLLTNPDLLKIDQTATASRQLSHDGDLIVWTADLPRNRHALAAFNVGEQPLTLAGAKDFLSLAASQRAVKNAWTGQRIQPQALAATTLDPHAAIVLVPLR